MRKSYVLFPVVGSVAKIIKRVVEWIADVDDDLPPQNIAELHRDPEGFAVRRRLGAVSPI